MRRRKAEDGASAVEFALVFPFLCLILFGMITTGLTYNNHLSVSNAVREGARFGAAVDYSDDPDAWASSVRQRVVDVYFNDGSPIDPDQICVMLEDAADASLASLGDTGECGEEPDSPDDMAAGSCVVKVWARKEASIELIIFPSPDFNIGAKSVSYYGRTVGECTAS